MSRIGKTPLKVIPAAKVIIEKEAVRLEGSKGKGAVAIPRGITVEQKDDQILVHRSGDGKQNRANHGTVRSLLKSMLIGVTQGHKKELEIEGVGFRAQLQGTKLILNLGLSHQIEYQVPKEVKVTVPSQTNIIVEGADKNMVGLVAAKIRDFKRPEPYKGKGIRYAGEVIRRKQGKSATK
ncbi:MAG: 50S ribosomal protein L6 [Candidatus Omnitrophica bacterium]|nr:50S ribosomal protein L6 [Candidatus Omnitrophota bacterium]